MYYFVLLAVLTSLVVLLLSKSLVPRASGLGRMCPGREAATPSPPSPPPGNPPRSEPEVFPWCDIHPPDNASPGELASLAAALKVWLESQPPGTSIAGIACLERGTWPINPDAPTSIHMVAGVPVVDDGEHFPAKVFGKTEGTTGEVVASLTESVPRSLIARVVEPNPYHHDYYQR